MWFEVTEDLFILQCEIRLWRSALNPVRCKLLLLRGRSPWDGWCVWKAKEILVHFCCPFPMMQNRHSKEWCWIHIRVIWGRDSTTEHRVAHCFLHQWVYPQLLQDTAAIRVCAVLGWDETHWIFTSLGFFWCSLRWFPFLQASEVWGGMWKDTGSYSLLDGGLQVQSRIEWLEKHCFKHLELMLSSCQGGFLIYWGIKWWMLVSCEWQLRLEATWLSLCFPSPFG